MPTATFSFAANRRLLNYMYDQTSGKRTIAAVMDATGAAPEDIDGLHWSGMVRGVPDGASVRNLSKADRDSVTLSLTAKGRAWVATDPLNKLLRAVRAGSRGQISLWLAVATSDKALVRHVWESQLGSVHFAGDGRELTRLTDYDFQHSRDYLVRLTAKGAHALGPKP